jgi:hypothetical protein
LKKRSGTKQSLNGLPDPVLFVDHALGTKSLPNALRERGFSVEVLSDHFSVKAVDIDWIPKVAEKGWVILTKDKHIRRNQMERLVLEASGAYYFVLGGASWSGQEQIEIILQHLPTIIRLVQKRKPPLIGSMNKGELNLWSFERERWEKVKKSIIKKPE